MKAQQALSFFAQKIRCQIVQNADFLKKWLKWHSPGGYYMKGDNRECHSPQAKAMKFVQPAKFVSKVGESTPSRWLLYEGEFISSAKTKGEMPMQEPISTYSCEFVMNTQLTPQPFIVYKLLYPGLYILAGAPKVGKSWLVLDLCLSVAEGRDFLGQRTEKGQVVYLALEDSLIRLQNRVYEFTDEPTDNLDFAMLADSIGNGLEEQLEALKTTKPEQDNAVYLYMLKKESEGKPKKVAKIAALNKFLRIYYARVKSVYNNSIFLDSEPEANQVTTEGGLPFTDTKKAVS